MPSIEVSRVCGSRARIASVRAPPARPSSSAVLIETLFFAALAPLLPGFADEFSLSKWESGLLVAAYALGGAVAAVPAGVVATRTDVRRVTISGLLIVAGTSAAFGVVDTYWLLVLARFAQGAGGSFVWTGALAWLITATPRARRGEMIGIAMAAAIGGALLGPVLGGAAEELSRAGAFIAVASACVALAVWALRIPSPGRGESQPLTLLLKAARSRRVLVGMWLLALPALLFGTLGVLGPLQLDRLGWGVVGVAGTFFVSAAIEAVAQPPDRTLVGSPQQAGADPVRARRSRRDLARDPVHRRPLAPLRRGRAHRHRLRRLLDTRDRDADWTAGKRAASSTGSASRS